MSNNKLQVVQPIENILNVALPQDINIEKAILGAILSDKEAFYLISNAIPSNEYFYDIQNQHVFSACQNLQQKNKAIDLLTVQDELRKIKRLEQAGGLEYLMSLTEGVASSHHIEHHADILAEKFKRRFLIQHAINIQQKAFDESVNIYKVYENSYNHLRGSDNSDILIGETLNQAVAHGMSQEKSKWIIGNLVKEKEVIILFADAGTGKTVLAYQMAVAAAEGKSLFNHDDFRNECKPKKTLYIDFEMERSELADRYSFGDRGYDTSDNVIRYQINERHNDLSNLPHVILSNIEKLLYINDDVEFIIIDNISWLISESTDNTLAAQLMKRLRYLQQTNPPLSIMVLAHTPKRDSSLPIEMRHLAGASSLSIYTKSLIALSKSKVDPNLRYVKHLKCRNGYGLHGEDNVIEMEMGKYDGPLKFILNGFGPESNHLAFYDHGEQLELWIDSAVEHYKKHSSYDRTRTYMKEEFDCPWSKSTTRRKIQARMKDQSK